jgi:5,10-methylenetetrahydromethanopterin reductase
VTHRSVKVTPIIPALPLVDLPVVAKAAEDAGFAGLRLGDMQSTARETFCALTVLAGCTSRLTIGTGVTNPVTRQPAVAASAIASIDELAGGRAVYGHGVGDSAVHNAGLRSATVAELEEYIRAVRSLHTTGHAVYRGNEAILTWWSGRPIPIAISAHGPRTLQLAGRVADIVISGLGMNPQSDEFVRENLAVGARQAGRDVDDIEVVHLSYVNLADSSEEAAAAMTSVLAVAGNLLRQSKAAGIIPDTLRGAFDELGNRYVYRNHAASSGENPNGNLVVELGLMDYLASNFGVFGTAQDVRDRLEELHTGGVTHMVSGYVRPDFKAFFERWGAEIVDAPSASPDES